MAIERLFCEGVQTINLGGGASAGDGISEFKARLGGKPVQFAALHQIYDASAYDVLCEHAGARGQGSYFPAYRDPRASRPPAE